MKDSLTKIVEHLKRVTEGCDELAYKSPLKQYGDYKFKITINLNRGCASAWIDFADSIHSGNCVMLSGHNISIIGENTMKYLDELAEALTDNMAAISHQMQCNRTSDADKIRLKITEHEQAIQELKCKIQ